jgi:hypothetical protein
MLWTSLLSAVPSHWTGSVSAFCEVAALVLSWAITRPVTHHRNIPRCLEMLAGSASSQLLLPPTGWSLHSPGLLHTSSHPVHSVRSAQTPCCPGPGPFLVREGLGAHEICDSQTRKGWLESLVVVDFYMDVFISPLNSDPSGVLRTVRSVLSSCLRAQHSIWPTESI